jgi:hypothetical protein
LPQFFDLVLLLLHCKEKLFEVFLKKVDVHLIPGQVVPVAEVAVVQEGERIPVFVIVFRVFNGSVEAVTGVTLLVVYDGLTRIKHFLFHLHHLADMSVKEVCIQIDGSNTSNITKFAVVEAGVRSLIDFVNFMSLLTKKTLADCVLHGMLKRTVYYFLQRTVHFYVIFVVATKKTHHTAKRKKGKRKDI